jgi:hypothetical protein
MKKVKKVVVVKQAAKQVIVEPCGVVQVDIDEMQVDADSVQ